MIVRRLTEFPPNGGDYRIHVETYGPLPKPNPKAWLQMTIDSGLRGRGGAWFPAGRKMQTVIRNARLRHRRAVVVCNAMEGEPDSIGDETILREHPQLVLDGVHAAAQIIGARKAYVGMHDDAGSLELVRRALSQRPAGQVQIEIVQVPPRYVASEESALTHFIGGGEALPVFGQRPFEHGVRGRPTLVNNAETLAHLALLLRRGVEWFREVGTPEAPGTTLVSVTGDVTAPQVIEVAIGTPIREIVDSVGGIVGALQGFRVAGFGGAWVGPELMDMTWDPDALHARGLRAGAGILSAISDRHCSLVESARTLDYLAGESAGQCGVCSFGLSGTSAEFTALANMRADAAAVGQLQRQLAEIPRRGGCALPDGAVGMAQSAITVFPNEVRAHLGGQCIAGTPYPNIPWQALPAARPHPVVAPGRHFQ